MMEGWKSGKNEEEKGKKGEEIKVEEQVKEGGESK